MNIWHYEFLQSSTLGINTDFYSYIRKQRKTEKYWITSGICHTKSLRFSYVGRWGKEKDTENIKEEGQRQQYWEYVLLDEYQAHIMVLFEN